MLYEKYIKHCIRKSKIVSFDMFDTLVFRKIGTSQNVFKVVEKLLEEQNIIIKDFYTKRMQAETLARAKYQKKLVNYDEIYNCIDFDNEKDRNEAKKIEKEIEYETIICRKNIKKLYDYAVEKNKKVIVVSDMYFDKQFLEKILNKEGYNFDKIYVSVEYQKSKSQGELFDIVLKENDILGKDMVHIGDSKKGDFLKPLSKKIKSCLIRRAKNNNKVELNMDLIDKIVYDNINFDFANKKFDNYFEKVGTTAFGPLLLGFSNWLIKNLEKEGINKVFFLSRDGFILKKAFDIINNTNITSSYLYVSRRSTSVPLLWNNNDFEHLDNIIAMSNQFTNADFINRLGLDINLYEEQLKNLNLDKDETFSKSNYKKSLKLKKFYQQIENDVIKNSKQEYDKIIKYLEQEKFSGKIAIVDIGWHGSIQRNLQKLAPNVTIKGYYMGCSKRENMHGFLFSSEKEDKQICNHLPYGIFETLFLEQCGSVKKYKIKNNEIEPIFELYEFRNEIKLQEKIENVHTSALEYVKNNNLKILYSLNTSCKCYLENLYKIMNIPTKEDVKMFGPMPFYDTFYTKIITSQSLAFYCFHPSKFFKDFYLSTWREGFLKKVFKLNLKYYKIVDKIRLIYKKKTNK